MIDFKDVHRYENGYVDGKLTDGRLVVFKTRIPFALDNTIRQIVAMANTAGGLILFGIAPKSLSVVGLFGGYDHEIKNLKSTIENLSLGIKYSLTCEEVNKKVVASLTVERAESTAYFSRKNTSPARQIAYRYIEEDPSSLSFAKEGMFYTRVFKYMTIDTFLISLYTSKWRFFEPSKWNDKFEQRFYCARYTLSSANGNTPQVFASCVTRAKNSEAAWKVYSHGQGLGAHCVQLELDVVELRRQLRASRCRFEEKPIVYENETVILNLHKKRKPYYKKYFGAFTVDSFLKLLTLKRDAYDYEQELRFFIIPPNKRTRNTFKKAQSIDLDFKWCNVIKGVRVDKNCTDAELLALQRACFSAGINPIIKGYDFACASTPPAGLKDIEFERFDIDDMPGSSRITIS